MGKTLSSSRFGKLNEMIFVTILIFLGATNANDGNSTVGNSTVVPTAQPTSPPIDVIALITKFLVEAKANDVKNAAEIASLSTMMKQQGKSISKNAGKISKIAGGGSKNAGGISKNAGAIKGHSGRISKNAGGISKNAGGISKNAGAIKGHLGQIADLKRDALHCISGEYDRRFKQNEHWKPTLISVNLGRWFFRSPPHVTFSVVTAWNPESYYAPTFWLGNLSVKNAKFSLTAYFQIQKGAIDVKIRYMACGQF